MIEWPITPQVLLTVAGIALFGSLATQWLKQYIREALLVNLICLMLCLAASVAAYFALAQGRWDWVGIYTALLTGFVGASLATFGYEVIKNLVRFVGPSE